jgi:serine/threonine-protein kinase
MPFTLTVESFLTCLWQSGLVERERVEALRRDLNKPGAPAGDPRTIADLLVREQTLTSWQAENLLRGKRRGFVLDKYRLLAPLGRGGMSAVYLAEHSIMRRRCAIKILPAKHLSDQSSVDRFQQEARAVALLDHTNIVRAYDVGKVMDGKTAIHFFSMELVEGGNLETRVARDGPLSPVEAANFIRQAAEGLAHAHSAGIVHRDIKPANLLLDNDGVVKILDLGLAKFFGEEPPTGAAGGQMIFGTVDFLSPEQALDSHAVDGRSDIYSLGCTFYFLLAGRAPFPQGTLTQRLVGHLSQQPVPIGQQRADVPADLEAILDRMLAKKPEDRIQTADEVAELLRQWLVRHADQSWLRNNPAVLTGLGDHNNSLAPLPAIPASSLPQKSVLLFESSSDASLGGFDPDRSTVTRSIIFRRRSEPRWWQFLKKVWRSRGRKRR